MGPTKKINSVFLLKRLIVTASYLKFTQLYYRIYYGLRKKIRRGYRHAYPLSVGSEAHCLELVSSIEPYPALQQGYFTFLNKEYHYTQGKIDWNYAIYGKLWTYNLTYFDYLLQSNVTKRNGLAFIYEFIEKIDSVSDGLMPFPISLRGINWIKFLSKHKIEDRKINDSLYAQYLILMDNIEYHVLGNHLLENGFSLLFGAYYFQDEKLYAKAKKILTEELEEQILQDGAHFELSPMYHQLMLFRVLDCINLLQNNQWKEHDLLGLLTEKAEIMLGWLHTMTFKNGAIPLLNDSANKIAPTTKELTAYALKLNSEFRIQNSELSDSGYRKVTNDHYEMVMDVGNIGPDYIPGHAHSDTFSFELYIDRQPVIVDTGLSTYEANDRRQWERSTKAHNTVVVDGDEQSQVWGGFRVAKRAKIIGLEESQNCIEATHDGYRSRGVWHTRRFKMERNRIVINDYIKSEGEHICKAYLHFYPGIQVTLGSKKLSSDWFTIHCINADRIELVDYDYSPEFHTKINAKCAIIVFRHELKIKIGIKERYENN